MKTHRMLRVLEAARAAADTEDAGNHDVFRLYWEFGSRIHHDGDLDFAISDALAAIGLDPALAEAADDESWDKEIRTRMDAGLELVGDDVGTPIIATDNSTGERAGYFGPVITRIPETRESLIMWDALISMMEIDGFFELKKTRTHSPDPGSRPEPI